MRTVILSLCVVMVCCLMPIHGGLYNSDSGASLDLPVWNFGILTGADGGSTATNFASSSVTVFTESQSRFQSVDETELLARTILNNAFEKSFDGYNVIAWILKHRFDDPLFPKTWFEIVLQPNQFACWSNYWGQPFYNVKIPRNPELYQFGDYDYVYRLAQNLVAHRQPTTLDATHGSKYFGLYSRGILADHPRGYRIGKAYCW